MSDLQPENSALTPTSSARETVPLAFPANALRELDRCINCGLCLQACPTYEVSLLEPASPRGRIQLLKSVADERLSLANGVDEAMESCLGCRACETACPVNVQYGIIFNAAREALAAEKKSQGGSRLERFRMALTRGILRRVIPSRNLLLVLRALLWFGQHTGLMRAALRIPWLERCLGSAAQMARVLPRVTSPFGPRLDPGVRRNQIDDTSAPNSTKGSAFLFLGCVQEALAPETNRASARLLRDAGMTVDAPPEQTCCGALHSHTGDTETARQLAQKNIAAFERFAERHAGAVLIANAGGCGTMLKEYPHLFAGVEEWEERACAFAARVLDISVILLETDWRPANEDGGSSAGSRGRRLRVTYQDSCHLCHGQGVFGEPRNLLQRLPDVEFVELPGANRCCGSAGIYNLLQPSWSSDILEKKMESVARLDPDIIVTSNPGCYLQMKLGVHSAGLEGRVEVVSLPDFLVQYQSP